MRRPVDEVCDVITMELLRRRHGLRETQNLVYPLQWVVRTARMPLPEELTLRSLDDDGLMEIVNRLENGGSVDEAVKRCRTYLKRKMPKEIKEAYYK